MYVWIVPMKAVGSLVCDDPTMDTMTAAGIVNVGSCMAKNLFNLPGCFCIRHWQGGDREVHHLVVHP